MNPHLRIEELDARFAGPGAGGSLLLAIRRLRLTLARQGLVTLIDELVPEESLQVAIRSRGENACAVEVEAMRWGFTARIVISLEPATDVTGGILINVNQDNSWSPLDRTMLNIAVTNIDRQTARVPELTRLGYGTYRLDLQRLIRDRLLDASAPVRWDARLDGITGTSSTIELTFEPSVTEE